MSMEMRSQEICMMESETSPLLLPSEVTKTKTYSSALRRKQSRRRDPRVQPLHPSTPTSQPETSAASQRSLFQICSSLPYHLLCFASPHCAPCCCLCCCPCIRTSEYGVLERFGKFDRVIRPGMHVIRWPMERVAGRVSVRIKQLDIECVCKSVDHVFLDVRASIQFRTNEHQIFQSFYTLKTPTRQLMSHTLDILQSTLTKLNLDDILASQESIALDLHRSLNGKMNQYGFTIHHVLLTRLHPNDHVRHSMNEIEASKRIKESIPHKAEAIKIECMKKGEAAAERSFLNGVGIARQRREIARGLAETAETLTESSDSDTTSNFSTKAAMDLLLLSQYLDVLSIVGGRKKWDISGDERKDVSASSSTSLLLPHFPQIQMQHAPTSVKVENLLELV